MFGRLLLGGAIGVIAGSLIGSALKGSGGTCPILCNPTIAAVFFGAIGLLIAGGVGARAKVELAGFQSVETEQELNVILTSDRPALVEFYTDWCGYCRQIAPMMSSFAEEYGDRMEFIKIDGDKARELTQKYSIRGYPTILIFSEGAERERIVGAKTEAEFRSSIERAISAAPTAPSESNEE